MFKECRALLGALLALGLWAGLGSTVSAQTISQPVGETSASGVDQGQSFTATITGAVTQIDVRSRSTGPFFLRLYNGGVGSGVSGSIGTPAFSQAVTLTDTGSDVAGLTLSSCPPRFP